MPREVSLTALQAMLSQQTGEVFLVCLKISHDELASPLRFVNNTEPIIRADGEYLPAAFEFRLPDDSEDNVPTAEISIDNVDRKIIESVRGLKKAPELEVNIVLASSPNTVEVGPVEFKLKEFRYDAQTISATLGYEEDFLNQGFPKYKFSPQRAKGLF